MKMVPVKQATHLLKKLAKSSQKQKVTLLTRKKDRSLTVKINDSALILTEQGYENSTRSLSLESSDTKHILLAAFKREFPRSHRVYVDFKR